MILTWIKSWNSDTNWYEFESPNSRTWRNELHKQRKNLSWLDYRTKVDGKTSTSLTPEVMNLEFNHDPQFNELANKDLLVEWRHNSMWSWIDKPKLEQRRYNSLCIKGRSQKSKKEKTLNFYSSHNCLTTENIISLAIYSFTKKQT